MEERDDIGGESPRRASMREDGGKRGRRRVVFWMAVALVILLAVAGLMGGLYAWRFLDAAKGLAVGEVDPSSLPDGEYAGTYIFYHVKAEVRVEVEGGRIAAIELVDAGRMAQETREDIGRIYQRVVSAQSLDVDLESGASVSKKVALKAVEEALAGKE